MKVDLVADEPDETIDAEALASMSDAEMARLQGEMAKKAAPVETPQRTFPNRKQAD